MHVDRGGTHRRHINKKKLSDMYRAPDEHMPITAPQFKCITHSQPMPLKLTIFRHWQNTLTGLKGFSVPQMILYEWIKSNR